MYIFVQKYTLYNYIRLNYFHPFSADENIFTTKKSELRYSLAATLLPMEYCRGAAIFTME